MSEQTPEFSFPVVLSDLPRGGATYRLATKDDERKHIKDRLGVAAVNSLEGAVKIRANRAEITLTGSLVASLTRECVASLEEMIEDIAEEFDVTYLRAQALPPRKDSHSDRHKDKGVEDEGAALPDIHEGDDFDLGDFLVQQLSLAMDPFPRKEGARSLAEQYGQAEEKSAFAAALGEAKKIE